MRQQFEASGLRVSNTRTVSHYRVDILKRLLPAWLLAKLDSWAQPTGNWWQLSPSLFLQAQAQKPGGPVAAGFFRCPNCRGSELSPEKSPFDPDQELLTCQNCQSGWAYKDGIYDFKTPVNHAATA